MAVKIYDHSKELEPGERVVNLHTPKVALGNDGQYRIEVFETGVVIPSCSAATDGQVKVKFKTNNHTEVSMPLDSNELVRAEVFEKVISKFSGIAKECDTICHLYKSDAVYYKIGILHIIACWIAILAIGIISDTNTMIISTGLRALPFVLLPFGWAILALKRFCIKNKVNCIIDSTNYYYILEVREICNHIAFEKGKFNYKRYNDFKDYVKKLQSIESGACHEY